MEVMFTTHPDDGPGDYYMVVASKEEWGAILMAIDNLDYKNPEIQSLVKGLEGWGI